MKKTDDNYSGKNGVRHSAACRVAYSLNNSQPVVCTIISDQPFFYMDEEMDIEDDSILSYETLDEEIASLKAQIENYDRFSLNYKNPRDTALQSFICNTHDMDATDNQSRFLEIIDIQTALNKSRYASALIAAGNKNNIVLKLSDQIEKSYFDREQKTIFVHPSQTLEKAVFNVIREYRRHWQLINGTLLHPMAFHPDHAVLVNRAQLADLALSVIRTAWELKLAGLENFWAEIENSSLSDLGRAFAREALLDFRTLNNGKASSAVFETWFLSERCNSEDKKLIQMMLNDYQGHSLHQADASKMVTIELICQLGEQPFGNNYLAPYADMILNDPIFTNVRDRSNANFLWFIKFERTFKETEQELQPSIPETKQDLHHAFSIKENGQKNQGQDEDNKHDTNNVIQINFTTYRLNQSETQSRE